MFNTETKQAIQLALGVTNIVYDPEAVKKIIERNRSKAEDGGYGFSQAFIESGQKKLFNIQKFEAAEKARLAHEARKQKQPEEDDRRTRVAPSYGGIYNIFEAGGIVDLGNISPSISTILSNNRKAAETKPIPVKMIAAYYSDEAKGFYYSTFTTTDKPFHDLRDFSSALVDFENDNGVEPLTGYVCLWDDIVERMAH